jgi:hypothetical protein
LKWKRRATIEGGIGGQSVQVDWQMVHIAARGGSDGYAAGLAGRVEGSEVAIEAVLHFDPGQSDRLEHSADRRPWRAEHDVSSQLADASHGTDQRADARDEADDTTVVTSRVETRAKTAWAISRRTMHPVRRYGMVPFCSKCQ